MIRRLVDPNLPPGWEAFEDTDGTPYFHHEASGETTFDRPEMAELPPEWEAFKDGEGREYYYNKTTGETSWERPDPDLPAGWESF